MSVRFPMTNANSNPAGGRLNYFLAIPTAVSSKAASTGYTTAFFFRTPRFPGLFAQPITLLARGGGSTGGSDGEININGAVDTLGVSIRSAGAVVFSTSAAIALDKTYFVILIANAANTHLVVQEVGGAAVRVSAADATLFNLNMSTNRPWSGIGGGNSNSNRPCYHEVEHVAMWTGLFPETSGVPDMTLISNLANGVTAYSAVAAAMTGGTARFHYPLTNEVDLSDAFSGSNPVVETGFSRAEGRVLYPSGPLRPARLMPAFTAPVVSQVVFATPGDGATATAQIKIEGGSYNGLAAMSKVQARLVDEARTVVRDWTDLTTTAPSAGAGTWAASAGWTGVPMQASHLFVEFRALDSGGNVIAGPVSGYGLRGAGFHILFQSQSQGQYLVVQGPGKTIASGIRAIVALQSGSGLIPAAPETGEPEVPETPQRTDSYYVASGCDPGVGVKFGIRQAFEQIHALYPGVPVQFSNVAQSGTSLILFADYGGTPQVLSGRWAGLRDGLGVVQPYLMLHMGHSAGTSDTAGMMAAVVAWSNANFGPPIRRLHVPVPRYKGAGTDETVGNAAAVAGSRNGIRNYIAANAAANMWCGSGSNVFTQLTAGAEAASGSDPHPDNGEFGQGRTAMNIAAAWLMGCRAISDVPLGITAVRAVGGTAVIEFGAVNA